MVNLKYQDGKLKVPGECLNYTWENQIKTRCEGCYRVEKLGVTEKQKAKS